MKGLRPVDRFQIVTTSFFIALGVMIVIRSAIYRPAPGKLAVHYSPSDGYMLGGLFVLFGVYRAWFIVRALRRRMRP